MKKVCYVSDNRTGLNWGAKATSIALAEILDSKLEVTGTIYNKYKKQQYIIGYSILGLLFFKSPKYKMKALLIKKVFQKAIKCLLATLQRLKVIAPVDFRSMNIMNNIAIYQKYLHLNEDLKYIDNQIKQCDIVVVNGEGDMILNSKRKTLIFLLNLMEIGRLYGKELHFVNAMISPCPIEGVNEEMKNNCLSILRKCTSIQLRDSESINFLKTLDSSIKTTLVPDALFAWNKYLGKNGNVKIYNPNITLPAGKEQFFNKYDFTKPYIIVSGSSIAPSIEKDMLIRSFIELVNELKTLDLRIYLLIPCKGDEFLYDVALSTGVDIIFLETPILLGAKIISNCALFISGRYHPSIIAAIGGARIICFRSNSHKMIGLQKILGVNDVTHFQLPLNNNDISKIIRLSVKYLRDVELKEHLIKESNSLQQKVSSLILTTILDKN